MGGTGAIVDALTRLMQRHGIEVLTGADVSQINMTDKKVSGVTLDDGSEYQIMLFATPILPSFMKRC